MIEPRAIFTDDGMPPVTIDGVAHHYHSTRHAKGHAVPLYACRLCPVTTYGLSYRVSEMALRAHVYAKHPRRIGAPVEVAIRKRQR